jgi:2-polyprenyl-3-methyl-5-hydroxy-6-metoxy-1,4-benzoquinol methylase
MDYGCGPGYLLRHLIETGCDVWGGDFSEDVVGKAGHDSMRMPNFHGVHTISSLLGVEQFDVVFLLEVIEHLDAAALDETIGNIDQLLKRGGRLIVTTPNDERLEDNIVYSPVANVTFHRWQHVRSWSSDSLSSFLRRRGYDPKMSEVNFRDANESSSIRNRISRFLHDRFEKPAGLYAVATKL